MVGSVNALSLASPESAAAFVDSLNLEDTGALPVTGAFPTSVPVVLRAPLRGLFQRDMHPALGAAAAATPAAMPAPMAEPATGSNEIGLRVKAGLDQVFLVGSQLMTFTKEVTEDRRAAAINSCLLAQLQATKLNPNPDTPEAARAWHATFINTLTNIGWSLQSGVTAQHRQANVGVQVDKVLIDLLGVFIGGGAALALITKVLQKLADAQKDDPFITLYESRMVQEDVVEFGAGLASGTDAGFMLSVVECAIKVRSAQKQILVFKWNADSAEVDGRRFDLSVSDTVFAAVKSKIEQLLSAKAQEFVASLDLG
jgi:hypothetical protein